MFIVRREPRNPILTPHREHPWEALAAFNPSVIREPGGWRLFYRALSNPDALLSPYAGQSTIGEAFSEDGVHFHSQRQVLMPQESWDAYGCEDPRATLFEGTTYLTYTALGGYPFGPDNIKTGIAVGRGGEFAERHQATTFNAKGLAIFPERAGGKVAALLSVHTDAPPSEVCVVLAERIEDFWTPAFWDAWHKNWQDHKLPLRRGGNDHVEVGAPPLLTDRGWLVFYSYIQNYFGGGERVFCVEAALLDRDDPHKILDRTESILVPEEIYELYGIVQNIVFPTGATLGVNDTVDLWYGAADTVCAKATIKLPDLLRNLDPSKPARTFRRAAENPLLSPQGDGFESRATFNAAAVDVGGKVHLLYRAMDAANTSTVGLAVSRDGVHIDERLPEPVYVPRADFEKKLGNPTGNSGCEDPRAVVIGDRLYMTYTAFDGIHAPRGAVSSISVEDFLARKWHAWTEPYLLTPDGVDDKDLALLPERLDGNFMLYHRISSRICADILPDFSSGKRVSRCIEMIGPRKGMWDTIKVGVAGPPIRLDSGNWLMIYHGVSFHGTYRLGLAMLDPSGTTVLTRTAGSIFEPAEDYEKTGQVGNVVFSCGQVVRGDDLFVYYGGADKVVGVAIASLSRILRAMS